MKILHTADIHIKEFEDERWNTLQKLIEIGGEQKIDIFIISGDLFDKDFNAEILRPKIRDLFSNNNFKIVIIPGNHDRESYKSDMYFGEDAIIISDINKPYEIDGVNIWGLPFENIDSEKILRKLHSIESKLDPKSVNILLYHGELLDAFFSRKDFGDEGEERYMPVKLSYFKDLKIDYILAGHFHSKFDIRSLESGGYFVYPGSPVSITKGETGQRAVNIFKVGKPPNEFFVDTPHFEKIRIELDPFSEQNPVKLVKEKFAKAHPEAKIILTIKGFFNKEKIMKNEMELADEIRKKFKGKYMEEHFEFQDIHTIIEDNLFKSFLNKLEKTDIGENNKNQMIDLTIQAMTGTRR